MSSPAPTKRQRPRPRACRESGHTLGPWLACACDQRIPTHRAECWPFGPCAFEVRTCRRCRRVIDERHVADTTRLGVPQPGGPSAKTTRRAGSPDHRQGSKETPMLEPPSSPGRPTVAGRFVTFTWDDEHAYYGEVVAPTARDKAAPDGDMLLVQWQGRPGLRVWEYHDDLRPLSPTGRWLR